ncbi:MAG: cytochrome P450 [Candidatus Binatia bacterium]
MRFGIEHALAIAILVVAAWRLVRVAASVEFRSAFPREGFMVQAALAAYVVVVLGLAVVWPGALLTVAALALAWIVAVAVFASSGFGRRRGWPPGRLDLLSLGPWFQRWFFLDQHRRYGSPFKVNQFVKPMACVVGLPQGQELFRAHDQALASPPLWYGRFIPGGLMRHMAPAQHEVYREVFRDGFRPESYQALEPFMAETMRAALAAMAVESARDTAARDAAAVDGLRPRQHVQRMMFVIWARLFFSVAADDPEFSRLKLLYRVIDARNPSQASDQRIRGALVEIGAIVQRQVAALRALPGETPGVLAAMVRHHPAAADDPTTIGNLIYEMHITWADLSGFLVWLLRMLADHPNWAARLRSDDDDQRQGARPVSLAARIVSETLRMEQSEHLYRVAGEDLEHGGMRIPRGWLVRLCVQESHRDPQVFPAPDTFDPDRFCDRTYTKREYQPFGYGRHACIGEAIARTVGRLFVEELGRGWDVRTVQDGPPEYSSWRHWRPSSRWRVLVTARS